MEVRSKIKYIPFIVFLLLFGLYTDYAYSAGTPVIIPGTDPSASHLGAVKFREFTSGGNEEVFLGVPDLNLGGANRTEMNLTWSSSNTITFTYDPVLDKLSTSVDNGSANWSLEYTEFSTNVRDLVYGGDQAAADYGLNHLNYMQIDVTLREKSPAQLSLDNVQLDGIPLGNFSGVYHGTESWYVDGYDFSAGFSFTGVLNLSGITNPSPEKNNVEIILGSIVVDEPVISNVLAAPNPVVPETEITLTATAADSGTNNIQSAEYNIEGGPWNPMNAQDGTYDSPSEDVVATFTAPVNHGEFNVCVRATNTANNTGQEQCIVLSVDNQGPLTTNLQVAPNPVTSGGDVTLTATVDDSTTGSSNIQSAEYSLAGGPWNPLGAQDGSFDSPSEVVEATFAVLNPSGDYDLCVRGKDIPGNVGSAACTQLAVLEADNQGPLSSNLQVAPNLVTSGGNVTLTATVDDSTTGSSNIQSAEFSLAGGPWNPLNAQDGSFDSPSEGVEATFAVLNPSGDYDLCVRGKDVPGNMGSAACTQLTVSEAPDVMVDNYLPFIINQSE